MKTEVFSQKFSQQVELLARSYAPAEIRERLLQALSDEDYVSVLQWAFAYQRRRQTLRNTLALRREVSLCDLHEILELIGDSPHYKKLKLLCLIFGEEYTGGLAFASADSSFVCTSLSILFEEQPEVFLQVWTRLDQIVEAALPYFLWGRNYLLLRLFCRTSVFPPPARPLYTQVIFPLSMVQALDWPRSWRTLWLQGLVRLALRAGEKVSPQALVSLLAEVCTIGLYLGLELCEILSIFGELPLPSWGQVEQYLRDLAQREVSSPCADWVRQSPHLMLPLYVASSVGELQEWKNWDEWDLTIPFLFAQPNTAICWKSFWQNLFSLPLEKQGRAVFSLFLHSGKALASQGEPLFLLLRRWPEQEILRLWHYSALLPHMSGFLSHWASQILLSLQHIPSTASKLKVLYTLMESSPEIEGTFQTVVEEHGEILQGRYRLLAEVLQFLWQERRTPTSSAEWILQKVLSHPIVPEQWELLEEVYTLTVHSPSRETVISALPLLYLQDDLLHSQSQFSCTISSLASKAVLAKGWNQVQHLFERAFSLSYSEAMPYRSGSFFHLVDELVELSESLGGDRAWQKAFFLTTKMKIPPIQRRCLLRLLRLPSYLLSMCSSELMRVLRELSRIRCEKERILAMEEACEWLEERGHLISNKSAIRSLLRQISKTFRKLPLRVRSLALCGLLLLRWQRLEQADNYFRKALESALEVASKPLPAVCQLVDVLGRAKDLEEKEVFRQTLAEWIQTSPLAIEFQGEFLALLARLCESWWPDSRRARETLRECVQYLLNCQDPLKRRRGVIFLLRQMAELPTLFSPAVREELLLLIFQESSPFWRSRLFALLGRLYCSVGRMADAMAWMERALSLVDQIDTPLHYSIFSFTLEQFLEGTPLKSDVDLLWQLRLQAQKLSPLARERFYRKLYRAAWELGVSLTDLHLQSLELLSFPQQEGLAGAFLRQKLHNAPEEVVQLFLATTSIPQRVHTMHQLVRFLPALRQKGQLDILFAQTLSQRAVFDPLLSATVKYFLPPSAISPIFESLT